MAYLHCAAERDSLEIFRILLELNLEHLKLNGRNNKALTPLHLICQRESNLKVWRLPKDEYILML
jgi:hypothetical protein